MTVATIPACFKSLNISFYVKLLLLYNEVKRVKYLPSHIKFPKDLRLKKLEIFFPNLAAVTKKANSQFKNDINIDISMNNMSRMFDFSF